MSILSIILDVAVLIGLGITIFYCVRLTKSLNAFRSAQKDFGNIMRELSNNIDEAYRAVDNLKAVSRDSGQALQKTINESRAIARELEVMNKSMSDHKNTHGTSRAAKPERDEGETGFRIFDRESAEQSAMPSQAAPAKPGEFSSQAERDLYDALQNQQKNPRRGMA
jgi:hypothetical protein